MRKTYKTWEMIKELTKNPMRRRKDGRGKMDKNNC